ncbi:MAG: M23 family metallopeptidase [Coriobacteriia bacterium]
MSEPGDMRTPRRSVRRISQPSRLGPVRDTGITLGHRRRSMRRRRSPMGWVYAAIGVIIMVAIVGSAAILRPIAESSATADPAAGPTTVSTTLAPDPVPEREQTPMLASYHSLFLRLPVDPGKITQVAFHQASGDKAFHMEPLVEYASLAAAAKLRHAPVSTVATGSGEASSAADAIWSGKAIRLWRSNRTGSPDTAVDVGADPGTDVFSPVTGTVLQVRSYKLYSKYADYEVHIKPDGWSEIDVVLIHVDDVSVVAGDRVLGGITRIASVRKMSDRVSLQLGGYTRNGGDHVHMQLNHVSVPGRLEELTGS